MSQKIEDLIEKIRVSLHPTQPSAALSAVIDALEALRLEYKTYVSMVVQKLELKPGDVVLVKLGDPMTGWIPPPESEVRALELFTAAFKNNNIANEVCAVIWNYGLNVEVLAPKKSDAS